LKQADLVLRLVHYVEAVAVGSDCNGNVAARRGMTAGPRETLNADVSHQIKHLAVGRVALDPATDHKKFFLLLRAWVTYTSEVIDRAKSA
jgi:hypothetical protein